MICRLLLTVWLTMPLLSCEKKCKEYVIVEKDDQGRSKVVRVKSGEGCTAEADKKEVMDVKEASQQAQ